MVDTASESVLKRKAVAGRGHSGGGAVVPARVFGQALAKAAQDLMRLAVTVAEATETRISLSELPEILPERALLALLEGPNESLGLLALGPEVLASVIEMQTTGRIGGAEVAPRKPTRTDAAMSARLIDRLLGEAEAMLSSDPALGWAGGFRYSSHLDDPRPLALILEETGYRAIRLTLLFGAEEARKGTVLIVVPAEGRRRTPMPGVNGGTRQAEPREDADWSERMEAAVLGSRAHLTAVLDRVSLPLSAVIALEPGAVLPLSQGVLARLRIEGRGDKLVAYGKLGQCRGSYAVRLHMDIDPQCGQARPPEPQAAAEPAQWSEIERPDPSSEKVAAGGEDAAG